MRWCVFFALLCANLFAKANPAFPPPNLPVKVNTAFYLLNFTGVNEKDETFLADVYFSFRWNDSRLAFTPENPDEPHQPLVFIDDAAEEKIATIWNPQVEFINAVHPTYNNRTLLLYPNGDVEYHISITSDFYTGFNFKRFPFDTQQLQILLDSFSWNKNVVVFVPSTKQDHLFNQAHINKLEEQILSVTETEESIFTGPAIQYFQETKEFSTYTVNILIERKASYYMFQVFIPLLLVVGMSCMVFFGYRDPFLDKVMINLTAFLVILAAKFTINLNLPEIGYLTMIDKSFLASYVCIGLTVVVDVLQKFWSNKHENWAKALNKYARWSIFFLFVIGLIFIYFSS